VILNGSIAIMGNYTIWKVFDDRGPYKHNNSSTQEVSCSETYTFTYTKKDTVLHSYYWLERQKVFCRWTLFGSTRRTRLPISPWKKLASQVR